MTTNKLTDLFNENMQKLIEAEDTLSERMAELVFQDALKCIKDGIMVSTDSLMSAIDTSLCAFVSPKVTNLVIAKIKADPELEQKNIDNYKKFLGDIEKVVTDIETSNVDCKPIDPSKLN